MLTYDLTKATGSIYEYLYKLLKNDILDGKIGTGEKMPSKRSFAKNLGVSTITIENAYDQLISEGYLYTLPKRGYFVSDMSGVSRFKPREVVTCDIQMPVVDNSTDFNFSSNKMEKKNFPFSIWARLMRENMSLYEGKLLEVSPCGGAIELREAIAYHLASFRGMQVDPRQIIVGAGTEYLYGLLVSLLGKDKIYCIENPGYNKLLKIYSSLGVDCKIAEMDEKGIVVEELKKTRASVAHVSPTHHFPTGITTPIDRRYELLAWSNEGDGKYIIEDDYDSEFRINGKPIPTLQSIDVSEKVIYMNTFSKSLASTIRISYMVLPVHLANLYYEKLPFYSCTVSTFEQYTLAAFITQGYFEKHINRMRLYYGRKRKRILEIIDSVFSGGEVSIIENDSGLHFILHINDFGHVSEEDFKSELWKAKINIDSVNDYNIGKAIVEKHHYIINYSNIDMDVCSEYLNKLKDVIWKMK